MNIFKKCFIMIPTTITFGKRLNKPEIILGEKYKVNVEKLEKFNESLFKNLYIQAYKKKRTIVNTTVILLPL